MSRGIITVYVLSFALSAKKYHTVLQFVIYGKNPCEGRCRQQLFGEYRKTVLLASRPTCSDSRFLDFALRAPLEMTKNAPLEMTGDTSLEMTGDTPLEMTEGTLRAE